MGDNETQKKVSQNISALQRQQGFTIVQIAHRLTTLTNSDIIYFLSHGTVMEIGGYATQDGTAVEELNKVEIKRKAHVNPETREEEQRVIQGFFHQHWNIANDVKSFEELSLKKILEKARELRDELDIAQAEVSKKTSQLLPPPLGLERAVTAPFHDRRAQPRIGERLKSGAWAAAEDDSTADTDVPSEDDGEGEALRGPAPLSLARFISA